jgi:hypothetical protein
VPDRSLETLLGGIVLAIVVIALGLFILYRLD